MDKPFDCDYTVIGSGFGGSVSALRLTEKGYNVTVIEKGRRFSSKDFPKTNWNLRRWLWIPLVGFFGPFKFTFMRHVTVFSGVGVGGGSLVYANTLPIPEQPFFEAPSWRHLAPWGEELPQHYKTARRMLGATENRHFSRTDDIMKEIAHDIGKGDQFAPAMVGVFQGEENKTVEDPYFDGEGPSRTGCIKCGGCMLGCRYNAKNTLDKNYLYLAEKQGCKVTADTEVISVVPLPEGGYSIQTRSSKWWKRGETKTFKSKGVIFSGGVLGTVPLLQKLKEDNYLPNLSPKLGQFIRTNNESILGVLTTDQDHDFSKGVAISSIVHTGKHSHVEPVRYSSGSGFFRLLMSPHAPGYNALTRTKGAWQNLRKNFPKWVKSTFTKDFSMSSQIILYMESLDSTLTLKRGRGLLSPFAKSPNTAVEPGAETPKASIADATDFANRFAQKTNGVVANIASETVLGIPSTAHILGGCCMGEAAHEGVINHKHEVFGYPNMLVVDGSAISANPGVNPSLTITALAERAMTFLPAKNE